MNGWDLLLKPGNELYPDLPTLVAIKLFMLFKSILIFSLPAFREIAYLLVLVFWIGGIMGSKKSYQFAGGSLLVNIFLGLIQNGIKYTL